MSKIVINNIVKDSIPVNEVYIEGGTPKGLVFVQHGYLSNKERGGDYLAIPLARLGYFVVCVDAYKHGERKEEPFIDAPDFEKLQEVMLVITKTALDIKKLHEEFYTDYPTFDMIGVSLGGMVAYYLATETTKINKLIPVISTPDFLDKAIHAIHDAGLREEEVLTPKNRNYIEGVNPVNRMDKLVYEELLMLCGTRDNVVPMQASKDWYDIYKSDKITFKTYDASHNVTRIMQADIYEFLQK